MHAFWCSSPITLHQKTIKKNNKMKSEVAMTGVNRSFRESVLESRMVVGLALLMSRILGERITSLQALHLLHANLSFSVLILFCGISVPVCALLLLWFALSVWHCAQHFKA